MEWKKQRETVLNEEVLPEGQQLLREELTGETENQWSGGDLRLNPDTGFAKD